MPAIQPARLKKQVTRLAESFYQPGVFVRGLHELLDLYADRTHRHGKAGEPPPLLDTYNVPAPVLRQILQELKPFVSSDSQSTLALCDALWAVPYLEFRIMAVNLIGEVTTEPPEPVNDRLRRWAKSGLEERLLEAVFKQGMKRMRQEKCQYVLETIEEWLTATDTAAQKLGLNALIPLLGEPSFDNLPIVFRLIAPYLREISADLRPDMLALMSVLTRHSPQETAYILRQNLGAPNNPDTAWLIRQVLDDLPAEFQTYLRTAMREVKGEEI